MLDAATGQIAYAVIAFGPGPGRGGSLVAVPWAELTMDADDRRVICARSHAELERAPGFDADAPPDLGNGLCG
jgi:hypothetical protein